MDDLVKRSDIFKWLCEPYPRMKYCDRKGCADAEIINSFLLSVDAVEVRHGRWIQKEDKDWAGGGKTLCSKCKYGYSWQMYFEPESFKYCPNCGARMDGHGEDGET